MNRKIFFIICLAVIILFSGVMGVFSVSSKITAPLQPPHGPGGGDYQFSGFIKNSYGIGAHKYWIYEPTSPRPVSAPVIIFNHGWSAIDPIFYEGWLEHLVRKGNIVIYPQYQELLSTSSEDFTANAVGAVKDALIELEKGDHVKPELDKTAIVGHSAGGIISVNMAALATSEGLPPPKAVFCVQPGTGNYRVLENLSKIPSSTLLLTLAGDEDDIVGAEYAEIIIRNTTQIPLENKDYIFMVSDNHGRPSLLADHLAPLTSRIPLLYLNLHLLTDGLDYYGTWKLFDGLYMAAFYNKNREYALGNTYPQRYMGLWSDGKPVKELIVTNKP